MDVLPVYTTATAIFLSLQSITLFIFPSVILGLLTPPAHIPSALETYLSRSLAIALLSITIISLYFTYFPPPPPYSTAPPPANAPASGSSSAITHILTTYHGLSFIYIYTRYLHITSLRRTDIDSTTNTTGYILGLIGYGMLTCMGVWILVFGSAPSRRSKRTGADKRTSGWPFKNEGAYDKHKDRKMG
jgi:hypothetical protein